MSWCLGLALVQLDAGETEPHKQTGPREQRVLCGIH